MANAHNNEIPGHTSRGLDAQRVQTALQTIPDDHTVNALAFAEFQLTACQLPRRRRRVRS